MRTDKPIVLFLYDLTGTAAKPWVEAGCHAVLVDIQHPEGEHTDGDLTRIGADIASGWVIPDWIARKVIFAACWTPCDHMAVSGARWFQGKGLRSLAWSIGCCATGAEVIAELGVPGFVENPVSTLATYWRKPDHIFHPHQFTAFAANDNYTKKTCIWALNGFVMPAPDPLAGLGAPDNRIHRCPPGPERHNIRSATPEGFTRAIFQANRHLLAVQEQKCV